MLWTLILTLKLCLCVNPKTEERSGSSKMALFTFKPDSSLLKDTHLTVGAMVDLNEDRRHPEITLVASAMEPRGALFDLKQLSTEYNDHYEFPRATAYAHPSILHYAEYHKLRSVFASQKHGLNPRLHIGSFGKLRFPSVPENLPPIASPDKAEIDLELSDNEYEDADEGDDTASTASFHSQDSSDFDVDGVQPLDMVINRFNFDYDIGRNGQKIKEFKIYSTTYPNYAICKFFRAQGSRVQHDKTVEGVLYQIDEDQYTDHKEFLKPLCIFGDVQMRILEPVEAQIRLKLLTKTANTRRQGIDALLKKKPMQEHIADLPPVPKFSEEPKEKDPGPTKMSKRRAKKKEKLASTSQRPSSRSPSPSRNKEEEDDLPAYKDVVSDLRSMKLDRQTAATPALPKEVEEDLSKHHPDTLTQQEKTQLKTWSTQDLRKLLEKIQECSKANSARINPPKVAKGPKSKLQWKAKQVDWDTWAVTGDCNSKYAEVAGLFFDKLSSEKHPSKLKIGGINGA